MTPIVCKFCQKIIGGVELRNIEKIEVISIFSNKNECSHLEPKIILEEKILGGNKIRKISYFPETNTYYFETK